MRRIVSTVFSQRFKSNRLLPALHRRSRLRMQVTAACRLFIVEQFGQVRIFVNGTVLPTPFLDIHVVVSCCGEQGLLGLAFHPDYANNGFFYVYYTDVAGNIATLARYTVSAGDPNVADPDSHYPILSQLHQPYTNHNGGQTRLWS